MGSKISSNAKPKQRKSGKKKPKRTTSVDVIKILPSSPNKKKLVGRSNEYLSSLLIHGYTNLLSEFISQYFNPNKSYRIPPEINNIILSYFSFQYNIFGIGDNEYGEFCIPHEPIEEYILLSSHNDIYNKLYDCDDIKLGFHRFIFSNNCIYISGRNEHNDCGLGRKYRSDLQIPSYKQLCNRRAIISNGIMAQHSFVFNKNKLYGFGNNLCAQLGMGNKTHSSASPDYVNIKYYGKHTYTGIKQRIIQIECGHYHSLFLSNYGYIYSCGSNIFGQCGIKNDAKQKLISHIKHIKFINNNDVCIKDIICGSAHNLCCDNQNRLWVFGKNDAGQLGVGHDQHIFEPQVNDYFTITNDSDIPLKYINCGANHSLCIGYNGDCYLFGDNEYEQIYMNKDNDNDNDNCFVSTPYKLQISRGKNRKVRSLKLTNTFIKTGCCGITHTVLVTNKDQLIHLGQLDFYVKNIDQNLTHYVLEKDMIGIDKNDIISRVIVGSKSIMIITQKKLYIPLK